MHLDYSQEGETLVTHRKVRLIVEDLDLVVGDADVVAFLLLESTICRVERFKNSLYCLILFIVLWPLTIVFNFKLASVLLVLDQSDFFYLIFITACVSLNHRVDLSRPIVVDRHSSDDGYLTKCLLELIVLLLRLLSLLVSECFTER